MTTTDRPLAKNAPATPAAPARTASPVSRVIPAVTALALLVDAGVHVHLASGYQLSASGGIGAGNLFRVEAVVALAVAVWVLLQGTRAAYAGAFVVAVSALAAVILYRYVNVPMLGPLPAMYEPVWFPEKTFSAVAEAVAAVVAGAAMLVWSRQGADRTR